MKHRRLLSAAVVLCAPLSPASPLDDLWRNPAVEQRIAAGIHANRMSDAVVKCIGPDGTPRQNAAVRIEQTRHTFLFGANIFMLGGFPTLEENRRYEETYQRLFNYATVPFYWSDLELEPGKPRFAKDSPSIYRRPPPDAVVEFCQKNRLAMKGHPLVWHQWYPKWRPDEPSEVVRLIEKRIAEIAARYGKSIPRWVVVNEPLGRHKHADKWCNLPEDYVFESIRASATVFPAEGRMMINEATPGSWQEFAENRSPYYRLLRALIERGARVDEIGM